MATATRRLSWAVVFLGLLFLSGAPASSVSATSCAALQAWAQPLAGTVRTLDDLARYDRAHRHALFGAMTPEARAGLWRKQIAGFSAHAELSATQRALAQEGIGLLTPALYRQEAASVQVFRAFWQRAASAFGDPVSQRAWTDLAGTSSGATSAPRDVTYCDCKQGGGTAQCGGVSCGSAQGCTGVPGCGISGFETCNGMCQF